MTEAGTPPGDTPGTKVLLRGAANKSLIEWELALLPDALLFRRERESVLVKDADLSGVQLADSVLTLYSVAGSALELHADAVAEIENALINRICTMREVTRPLRGFGTRKGGDEKDHDNFFEPLLSARRQSEQARDADTRIAMFDVGQLRIATDRTLQSLAGNRFPNSAPDRRGFYETMNEAALPYYAVLANLETAATVFRSGPPRDKFTNWRNWIAVLEKTFLEADRSWMEISRLMVNALPGIGG